MADTTFTFRLDEDLKTEFVRAAKHSDRSASVLLRDFMREYIESLEHDTWFRREVEQGLAEAAAPGTQRRAHDDVAARVMANLIQVRPRRP
jgi:predicted transcriptional regulator